MKIGVPVFNNIITPRLDLADTLIIYEIADDKIKKKQTLTIDQALFSWILSFIRQAQLSILICGSCSESLTRILNLHGIDVLRNVMGDPDATVKELLNKFKKVKDTKIVQAGHKKRCRKKHGKQSNRNHKHDLK